jgi:hypothetical protein
MSSVLGTYTYVREQALMIPRHGREKRWGS